MFYNKKIEGIKRAGSVYIAALYKKMTPLFLKKLPYQQSTFLL